MLLLCWLSEWGVIFPDQTLASLLKKKGSTLMLQYHNLERNPTVYNNWSKVSLIWVHFEALVHLSISIFATNHLFLGLHLLN